MPTQPDIPGYTFVSKIAEGGMATVWQARQEQLDRVVAIKVMDKDAETDEREVERFIYEARAAASLIHPNIVQVIDAGERPDFMYYVMEYVPGPTAGELVDKEGALPEKNVLQIAAEVAEGLEYAWRDHKVVHCDIKPDNLLLHRNGRTKIADLGLAQVLGKEAVSIEDDMTIGTPNYFPPEQALVEEPFDCRTDMYALGATMYHLATGKLPFGGLEPDEVASEQVHGELPSPRSSNPKLSKPFCGLLEKLMAKSPEDRHESWERVRSEIKQVVEGELLQFPLPPEKRSTVPHTPQPMAPKERESNPESEKSSSPVRTIQKGTIQHRSPLAEMSAAQKETSLWPMVMILGIIVVSLYAYTFLLG